MRPFFASRLAVPILILASLTFTACDSSSGENELRVAILITGNGSGSVSSRHPANISIDCRVENGIVEGTCEDTFIPDEDRGTIRLDVSPSPSTDFEWGRPCGQSETGSCEIPYVSGELSEIEVQTFFEAKTKEIVMSKTASTITMPGEDGAIFVTAQAVNEDGNEVLGVVYTWEVDRPDVVNILPQPDPRRVMVTANINGVATISATAQGIVGKTAIEVEFSN